MDEGEKKKLFFACLVENLIARVKVGPEIAVFTHSPFSLCGDK